MKRTNRQWQAAIVKAIFPFSVALTLVALNGCSTENTNPPAMGATSERNKQIEAEITQTKKQQSLSNPITIAVAIDQSGSMEDARVSSVTFSDLQPMLKKLEQSGGEIAVSAICDRSNRPLVRVLVPEPPRIDEKMLTIPTPPSKLVDEGSPFEKDEREKAYDAKMADYNSKVDQTLKVLDDYKVQLEQHHKDTQKRIADVAPKLEEILEAPRNCEETDIQNSLERANLFFSEPSDRWSQKPKRFALFITDGLDSFSQSPANLPPDAKVVVVNGSIDVGIFYKVKHDRFESPKQAIAYLAGLM